MQRFKLTCPSCGAKLVVDEEMERFACGYCGSEQIVVRKGGTVALKQITDAIVQVQKGTDKTAAELAIPRLEQELQQLYRRRVRADPSANNTIAVIFLAIIVWFGCTFAVVAAAAALSGGSYSAEDPPPIATGASVVILVGVIVGARWLYRRVSKRPNKRLMAINEEIEAKKELMAKNRAIIDS